MLRRLSILLSIAVLALAAVRADTPIRYDVTAAVASVPASGGASFGTKFFFASGNRVAYRIIPADQTEADPATRWEFWSSALGARTIQPAAGYTFVEVRALNANGAVVGQTLNNSDPHQEAALLWSVEKGATVPSGFDPGFSRLDFLNDAGQTAGETYSAPLAGPLKVSWDVATPTDPPVAVPLPAGCDYGEIRGLSENGEVLLYVKESETGVGHAAVWNGETSAIIGPAPDDGETFYGSNLAIDAVGNVAMLTFTPGVSARLHYIAAGERDSWQTFTFPAPDSSAYNLRIGGGAASFDTATGGTNYVHVALPALAQHRTFAGYRSYLNAAGALVFGSEGKLQFWDTVAATGSPTEVPVSLTTSSGGFDLVGFNDEGHLLVLNTLSGTRSLVILAPVFRQPTQVQVIPNRRNLKFPARKDVHFLLVKTRIKGDPPERLRFKIAGKPPRGLKFRAADGVLLGRAVGAKKATLRVRASYRVNGQWKTSAPAAIRLTVTRPASLPR